MILMKHTLKSFNCEHALSIYYKNYKARQNHNMKQFSYNCKTIQLFRLRRRLSQLNRVPYINLNVKSKAWYMLDSLSDCVIKNLEKI